MRYPEDDLVKMSDLSEKEQQFCSGTMPHKFSKDTTQWAFDAKGLPICQSCGVIDDRHVKLKKEGDKGETSSYLTMLIGYARVSTHEQTLNLQQDALTKAGCNKIFTDTASGAKTERIGLKEALNYVRKGDTLVVWRLDRLGRSLPHLITTMTDLEERGIGFKSLTENIDTTTSGGKLIFHIFGALAEFERNLIRERTQAGLVAARTRGRKGGRPRALTARQLGIARDLYEKRHPITEICRTLKVSRVTLYRVLKTRERAQQS
jgi:DNA invertase Pin-like site-specific DNA recombinase